MSHEEIIKIILSIEEGNNENGSLTFSEYLSLHSFDVAGIDPFKIFSFIKGCVLYENMNPRYGSATPVPKFVKRYESITKQDWRICDHKPAKNYESLLNWIIDHSENPYCAFGSLKKLQQYKKIDMPGSKPKRKEI